MCRRSTGRNFLKFWCKHFLGEKNPLKFTPVVRGGMVSSTNLVVGASRSFSIISFFPLKHIRAKCLRHCCKSIRNFTNHKENLFLLIKVLP